MPARPVGCMPEGWGVSGMGGAWCERCWVWSWCWRGAGGESRAEGQRQNSRQAWGGGGARLLLPTGSPSSARGQGRARAQGVPNQAAGPPRPSRRLLPPCDKSCGDRWGALLPYMWMGDPTRTHTTAVLRE